MLYLGDIFYCHVATNLVSKKKNYFDVTQKKLTSFFVHHNFFIFNFYIAHWRHADLPRRGLSPDTRKQLLRAAVEKKCFYYLGLIFVKHQWRAHILVKLQASFRNFFTKMNTVTGIFPRIIPRF